MLLKSGKNNNINAAYSCMRSRLTDPALVQMLNAPLAKYEVKMTSLFTDDALFHGISSLASVTVTSFFGVRCWALGALPRLYSAAKGAAVCMCSGLRDTIRLHVCH